ncbi:MAG: 23S rRNA (uracil(1939)-C(5))-methyltransferase RlmD [Bradymonadaceae bacterium]|nr:23S rRNA (uracil(1939)-C(5))-methyltransferase RlmD [Lujinxingiaceae bacterium]
MLSQPLVLQRGPRPGDELEVRVEEITSEGLGLAVLDVLLGPQREPRQYTVFVRRAVPGDHVRVRVEQTRRRRITSRIEDFISPSPMRIEPRCRHFGQRTVPGKGCGGCTLQSLSYRHQLAVKERIVKKLMADEGLDPGLVYPVIGQNEPWFYRNKMEFSFGDDEARDFALGLHPAGRKYDILSLEECFLESEFASHLVPATRLWAVAQGFEPYLGTANTGFLRNLIVREGKRTGERMIELVTTADETVHVGGQEMAAEQAARQFCDFLVAYAAEHAASLTSVYWTQYRVARGEVTRYVEHLMAGSPVLHEELHLPAGVRLRFEIHPRAFFQPNSEQAELLYATVLERTGLRTGEQSAVVLDLYCGTGTIGLCLAPFASKVVGIELQPDAVDNARKNAAYNGIENIEFFVGDVGKVLASEEFATAVATAPDIVILDPPRAGLLPEALEHLQALGAARIVYVSCNPKALARDLRLLAKSGYGYTAIQPVDMFPHTYHVENVVVLTKDQAKGP